MYAEQPMIVSDYPSVLQAVNVSRWEGWQPYVRDSVWNNSLDRQSYVELKLKVVETAAETEGGGSSSTVWIGLRVAAVALIAPVVWLVARGRRGRALKG
jgi:hypothetical protein